MDQGKNPSIPLERATEERLKINKITMFESDLSKTNEDIALQSLEILQTFVWWEEQGGGGGDKFAPTIKRL